MNKRAFISRNLLGVIFFVAAFGLIVWGAATKLTVYAAKPASSTTEASKSDVPEEKQFISGSATQAWVADTSTSTTLNGFALVEKATVSGVARTDGVYHQTGLAACPT
jgi:hypothetical protein